MDFKLKYLISVFLLLLIISCKTQNVNNQSYTKDNYVLAYKNAVLYGCIEAKTKKEFSKLLNKYNNTASREVSILFHDIYNRAMLLGSIYSKNIKPYESYGDLKGKTPVFSACIIYAFGKEVDSIAKETYAKTR